MPDATAEQQLTLPTTTEPEWRQVERAAIDLYSLAREVEDTTLRAASAAYGADYDELRLPDAHVRGYVRDVRRRANAELNRSTELARAAAPILVLIPLRRGKCPNDTARKALCSDPPSCEKHGCGFLEHLAESGAKLGEVSSV